MTIIGAFLFWNGKFQTCANTASNWTGCRVGGTVNGWCHLSTGQWLWYRTLCRRRLPTPSVSDVKARPSAASVDSTGMPMFATDPISGATGRSRVNSKPVVLSILLLYYCVAILNRCSTTNSRIAIANEDYLDVRTSMAHVGGYGVIWIRKWIPHS